MPGSEQGLTADEIGLVIAITVLAVNTHDKAAGIVPAAARCGATAPNSLIGLPAWPGICVLRPKLATEGFGLIEA